MKKLIIIILSILSIQGFSQIQYNTARKLVYVRTCNIHGKKPLTTDLNSNTYGYNSADSVWYSLVNGEVTATDTYYPYSAGKKKLIGSVLNAVPYKFSTVKKMYYYLTNNVVGNKPVSADFPTSIYRCVNTSDSLEYDKYNGIIRTVFVRYPYTPRQTDIYPTLNTRIYVSTTGSDASINPHNPATPYKTIAKISSMNLYPGDTVMFKCGEVFTGTITVHNLGTALLPIVLSSYGTGEKPIITGFTTVSGWTNLGSNIWESTSEVSTLTNCNIVIINGVNTAMGRYPNTGYLTFQNHSGTTSITSSNLTGAPNWIGAELVVRTTRWSIDKTKITNQSGGMLTYSPAMTYTPTDGYGFFIQNDVKTLDQQNEWYYNPSTKKIRIFSTSTPTNVQVASINYLVQATGKNYITYDNINFHGANLDVLNLVTCNHITIQNCNINYSGNNAINANDTQYLTIQNSAISNSNNFAIYSGGYGDYGKNALISHNTINNTGIIPGSGTAMGQYAIKSEGSNSTIEYNSIDSTGYIGIHFDGDNTTVNNNFVNNFCLIKDDGAGIYTWNDRTPKYEYKGRKIQNNIVLNGIGASAGTDSPTELLAEGIYLDDESGYIEVSGNTVANCGDYGLYVHNAYNITVTNNTLYNNKQQINIAASRPNKIRNVNLSANIFFSKDASQFTAEYRSTEADVLSFGTFNNNYYCRPLNESGSISSNNSGNWVAYSLAQWKTFSGYDAASVKSPFAVTSTNLILFDYSITGKTVAGLTGYKNLDGTTVTSYTLAPYGSIILIK